MATGGKIIIIKKNPFKGTDPVFYLNQNVMAMDIYNITACLNRGIIHSFSKYVDFAVLQWALALKAVSMIYMDMSSEEVLYFCPFLVCRPASSKL